MKNTVYDVFIDLDGVISDFSGKVLEISKGRNGTPEYTKGMMWKDIYRYNANVEPFFESLPKMPGADQLVGFIKNNFENYTFLTATGSTPKDAPQQKRNWVNKMYPGVRVITVGTSAQKAVYANPQAILIDDREASISPWRRAGGFGILHVNIKQTINELNKVL